MSLGHRVKIGDDWVDGFQVGKAVALSDWQQKCEDREFNDLCRRLLGRKRYARNREKRCAVSRECRIKATERLRAIDAGTRICPFCGKEFPINAYHEKRGRKACSRSCGVRLRGNVIRYREYTIGGETRTLIEWCRVRGVDYDLVTKRLRNGWDLSMAINTVPGSRARSARANGVTR